MRNNKLTLLALLFVWIGQAQAGSLDSLEQKKKVREKVKFSGMLQINHDYYSLKGTGINEMRQRRPANLSRLIFAPTISYKRFSLPFEFTLSSQSTNIVTPIDRFREPYALFSQMRTLDDVISYVSNPINRLGVSPTLGKFKLLLGTHTPFYSELVSGNISVFGAGFQFTGKRFFTSASYGISQPGIAGDSINNINGSYQRKQYAFRIGVGNLTRSWLALNVTGGKDTEAADKTPLNNVKAEEGIAGSLHFGIRIKKKWLWENEAAFSAFSDDLSALQIDLKEYGFPDLPLPIGLNLSTRADIAGSTAIGFESGSTKISAKALYVGAGYKSFGFPFFQSDRLELTLNPRFSFAKKRWFFAGSIGSRTNNLSGTKYTPMNQLIASVNLSGRITDALSINASYGNFGVRSGVTNDTFRVENIGQNLNIAPMYTLMRKNFNDVYMVSYALDRFEDLNVLSGNIGANNSNIFMVSWNRTYIVSPISVGLSYNNFSFESTAIQLANQAFNATLGYRFFKKKIRTSFTLGRLLNKPDQNASDDKQWVANALIDYRDKKGYGFGLRWNTNNYVYGSLRPNERFNENTIRINVSKQF